MMKESILNNTRCASSMPLRITESLPTDMFRAKPASSDTISTCMMSPLAKASTSVWGTRLSR